MGLSERFNAISEFIANKGAGRQKESAFDAEAQQAVKKIIAEVRKSSGDPGANQLFRDYKIAMGIPDRTRRTSFIGTRQYPSHLYKLLTTGVSLSLLLTACAPSPAVAAGESSGGSTPTAQSTRALESTAIPTATRTTEATAGQTPLPEATPTPETGSNFKVTVETNTLNLRAKPTTASGILGTAKSGDELQGFGVNRVIKADGTSQAWIAIKLADGTNAWVLDASYLVSHVFPTKDMKNLNADFTPLVPGGANTGGAVKQEATATATRVATPQPDTVSTVEVKTAIGRAEASITLSDGSKVTWESPEAEAVFVQQFKTAVAAQLGVDLQSLESQLAQNPIVRVTMPKNEVNQGDRPYLSVLVKGNTFEIDMRKPIVIQSVKTMPAGAEIIGYGLATGYSAAFIVENNQLMILYREDKGPDLAASTVFLQSLLEAIAQMSSAPLSDPSGRTNPEQSWYGKLRAALAAVTMTRSEQTTVINPSLFFQWKMHPEVDAAGIVTWVFDRDAKGKAIIESSIFKKQTQ